MQSIEIEIISAKHSTYWYADMVGETFEVYPLWGGYVVKEDYDNGYRFGWRHFHKDDVQIRSAQLRNEAVQRYGDNPVSEQFTG